MSYPGAGFSNAPFLEVFPVNENFTYTYASNLLYCNKKNKAKYFYSKIAVVAEDPTVRQNLVTFFTNYFFTNMKFNQNKWSVDGFATQDDVFNIFNTADEPPYCFAVTFKQFDTTTDNYEVEFSFSKLDVPDTT